MDIIYKGVLYYVERNEMENDKSLINRSIFLAKQQPKNNKEYDQNIKFSNIWVNKKILGCKYQDNIEKILLTKDKIYNL